MTLNLFTSFDSAKEGIPFIDTTAYILADYIRHNKCVIRDDQDNVHSFKICKNIIKNSAKMNTLYLNNEELNQPNLLNDTIYRSISNRLDARSLGDGTNEDYDDMKDKEDLTMDYRPDLAWQEQPKLHALLLLRTYSTYGLSNDDYDPRWQHARRVLLSFLDKKDISRHQFLEAIPLLQGAANKNFCDLLVFFSKMNEAYFSELCREVTTKFLIQCLIGNYSIPSHVRNWKSPLLQDILPLLQRFLVETSVKNLTFLMDEVDMKSKEECDALIASLM